MTGGPRRGRALLAALAAALACAPAQPAAAASEGGPLTQACRGVDERLRGPCRGAEVLAEAAAANCRHAGAPEGACDTPVTPRVRAAAVDAHEGSWLARTLGFQRELASDVPLRDAPWVGTHNSFNSVAEMGPTLSDTDSNQQLSLVDQLRVDVRSLELDVHWFPSLEARGRAPLVCHATGEHGGCSVERPLGEVLAGVRAWLAGRPDEVLLLYLEDHLDDAAGYAAGAAAVEAQLGDLLLRPPNGGASCDELPLELTRADVRAAGARVVIVSDCGVGGEWPAVAFSWDAHVEERPRGFEGFPGCGPDFTRATFDATLVRYYEDSTGVTANAATFGAARTDDGITPATAAQMTACGVDLLGLDQLLPDDGRLEALAWSWAPDEPAAGGDCALAGGDGRWRARDCGEQHAAACRAPGGSWSVTAPVAADGAQSACAAAGAVHAAPRTGYENALLRQAAGGAEAWVGLRRSGASWGALDVRG